MTEGLCLALAGESQDLTDVVAAVSWAAPWLEIMEGDELALTMLSLGEDLPEPAQSLLLWWIGSRRPDLVTEDAFAVPTELSEEFRAALRWTYRRGPDGPELYRRFEAASQDYVTALRELERAARDFPALLGCIRAIKGGQANLNMVLAQLPGGWSSAALQGGRKGMFVRAQAARDEARAQGVPLDFPWVRVPPRFSRLGEPLAGLCSALLAGFAGSASLDGGDRRRLEVPSQLTVPEKLRLAEALAHLGDLVLPLEIANEDWLPVFGTDFVPSTSTQGAGAQALRQLAALLSSGSRPAAWIAARINESGEWGDLDACLRRGYDVVVERGTDQQPVDFVEALEDRARPVLARHLLEVALELRRPEAVACLALERCMEQLVKDLSRLQEEVLTW